MALKPFAGDCSKWRTKHQVSTFLLRILSTTVAVVVVMTLFWIFKAKCLHRAPRNTGCPERYPTFRDRATVPLRRHTEALGVPGESKGVTVRLGERAPSKGALPGTGCLISGIPAKGGVSNIYGVGSPPGDCFFIQYFGFFEDGIFLPPEDSPILIFGQR